MEIIPAIYILDGRCVALYKGSYEQKKTYFKSPLEMAQYFQKGGAQKLHIVDLNGRQEGTFAQKEIIHRLCLSVQIPIQIESTFKNVAEMQEAFQLGISKVVLRPKAFALIKEAIQKFGSEKIIVEIDAKGSNVIQDHQKEDDLDVVDFAESLVPLGVKNVIYKDERSEGTLIHPNYDDVDRLVMITGQNLKIYVSGGISNIKHLNLLKKIGTSGAIIAKAFYERILSLPEALQAAKD